MAQQKNESGVKLLKDDISGGQIKNLYIFHGEEKYLLEHYLGMLKSKLVDPAMEQFNSIVLDGKGLKIDVLTDAVEGLPMFSEHKLVVVRDFDLYHADESQREILTSLISDIPESTCLVFVYDLIEFKADSRQKLHKAVIKSGRIIEFPKQETGDLITWLKRRFRALNKSIESSDAEYMLFICGKLMQPLTLEVEKVAAYAKSDRISRSDIDAVCSPVLDAVMYSMTDAVVEQRYGDAIKLLRDLITMKNEPIVLLAALGKQLRNLLCTCIALESGSAESFLRQELGINYPFIIQKTIGNARKLSFEWCSKAVQLCAECDYQMKTTGEDRGQLLEFLILRLSQLMNDLNGKG